MSFAIQEDHVPSTGEYSPCTHTFFEMRGESCAAFFDLGDNVAPAPSPNAPAWTARKRLQAA